MAYSVYDYANPGALLLCVHYIMLYGRIIRFELKLARYILYGLNNEIHVSLNSRTLHKKGHAFCISLLWRAMVQTVVTFDLNT